MTAPRMDLVDLIDGRIRAALSSPDVLEALIAATDQRADRRPTTPLTNTEPALRVGIVGEVDAGAMLASVYVAGDPSPTPGFVWGEATPQTDDRVLVRMSGDGTDLAIVRILSRIVTSGGGGSGSGLTNPMTTVGDMIVGDTDGAAIRLPRAASGTHPRLRVDPTTGLFTWVDDAATFQPLDAELSAIAGLTSAADRLPYFTGSGAAALATFTGQARNLLDDTTQAAQRTTLGLTPGTDVASLSGGVVPSAQLGSGAADQWTALGGDGVWANRWRVWGPAADVAAANTTWVDSGFSFTYTASDTSLAFVLWYIHNRQAATGALQLRWQNTTGNTGGNIRGFLEPGTVGNTGYGTLQSTSNYDTAYGGVVPDANNSGRYGRWFGRLLLPTGGTFPGTIKLQINSVAAAEARLVAGSWLQYAKF